MAGILQCTFTYSQFGYFFWRPFHCLCVPLHQYFLPNVLVTVGRRINPYQRHLSGLGWSIAYVDCFEKQYLRSTPEFPDALVSHCHTVV